MTEKQEQRIVSRKTNIARLNKSGHPAGNRTTRRSQAAFDRKDSRSKKPATALVGKIIKKQFVIKKVNVPAIQTRGAFGKNN